MYRAKADINHATSFYATRQSERDLFEFASNSPARSRRGEVLTNIPEEESVTDDEPRTFEQEEKYLDECLRGLNGSSEDLVNVENGYCEIEEYDFDDYNSIASTVSLLNVAAEYTREEGNPSDQWLPPQKEQTDLTQRVPSPLELTRGTNRSLHDVIRQREAVRRQDGIAKVQHWDKLGASGECAGDPKLKLLKAAETGDLLILQEVCQNAGVSPKEFLLHAADSKGNTAVHRSAQFGNLPCLQWLVSQLPAGTASLCNQDGLTPIALAIQNGHLPCVQWLVEEVHVHDDVTLLHEAARAGHDDVLRYLLSLMKDNDIQLDTRDRDGVTPAHLAAREGHLLCLQSLVEYNIDVTARDKDGHTPADYAHKTCQTGCSRYLVVVESCWLLAARVAKLHRELKSSKDESSELRKRLEVLERQLPTRLPDRPEADGGDQSDSTCSTDSRSTEPGEKSRRGRSRPKDATPDGQSPRVFDTNRSFYNYPAHATRNYRSKPEGELFVGSQTEDNHQNKYELSRLIRQRGSVGSLEPGGSVTPTSLSEMLDDAPKAEQAMAKQIASTTQRLLLSRHAHESEDSRRVGPILAREKRDDAHRTPHRTEPVVNHARGIDRQTQPILPLQYLTQTSKTKLADSSQRYPIDDRCNILRREDKFASSYSSDSNDTNSQGFPPSRSTNSSKSNSPILFSSSSRESSNSNSPVLRAMALHGKLEPSGISSDSGSSDFEQEHHIQNRITHRDIQSESRTENYKFYTTKSPTMKSNLRHEIQNQISVRPLPGNQKSNVNNLRVPITADEADGTKIKQSFSTDKYLGQNENAGSATMGASQHKKILTTDQILNGNQKNYNETPLDRNQTQNVNRTFTPTVEKSGFTGLRQFSDSYVHSLGEVIGLPTHSAAVNNVQRSALERENAVLPRNRFAHSNQSDFVRSKSNGYLTDGPTGYSSQSWTHNSESLHASRLRRTYHEEGYQDKVVWSPTSDHDVTFPAPPTKVVGAGSRTVMAAGPKTPPRKTVLSSFDNVRQEQGVRPLTLDNSQAEGKPWYEADDWE